MNTSSSTQSQSETTAEFTQVVHEVAKGGRTSILSGLSGHAIRIGLQVLLVRVLGAHTYGLYMLGRSVLTVVSRFALIGMQNAAVRFIAVYQGEGNSAQTRGTILMALAFVLCASSITGAGIWAASDWLATAVFDKPEFGRILRFIAATLPFNAALIFLTACARGFRKMSYYSGMTHIVHPLCVILCISAAFLFGLRLEGALLGFILATALAALLMLYGIMQLFPHLWSFRRGFKFSGAQILSFGSKVFLADFTQHLLNHTDRLMLGSLSGARDVGLYSISAFIGSKLTFFQLMLNGIFGPVIADLYHQGKHDELVRIFQTVSKWTLILTLPVFCLFLFLGDFILTVFGRDFQSGWSVLVILAVGNLINIGVGPVGQMLIMTDRSGLALFNSWFSGLLNIVMNVWLIPRYGMLGAAIATSGTIALLNVIRLVEVRYLYHCYPFRFGTLKTLAACAIAAGVVWQLSQALQLNDWGKLAASGAGCLVYVGLLTLFGWDEADRFIIDRLRRSLARLRT